MLLNGIMKSNLTSLSSFFLTEMVNIFATSVNAHKVCSARTEHLTPSMSNLSIIQLCH